MTINRVGKGERNEEGKWRERVINDWKNRRCFFASQEKTFRLQRRRNDFWNVNAGACSLQFFIEGVLTISKHSSSSKVIVSMRHSYEYPWQNECLEWVSRWSNDRNGDFPTKYFLFPCLHLTELFIQLSSSSHEAEAWANKHECIFTPFVKVGSNEFDASIEELSNRLNSLFLVS